MTQRLLDELPADGFSAGLDMRIVSASADVVVLEWVIAARHLQPRGIVHGGVYCGAVETACSIGASLSAASRDPNTAAVGLENQTSFIRAVRSGTLRAVARPLTRGRTTQVWQAEIRDEGDRLIASGRVRLLVVSRDTALG
jgi:uncharacterized protein (TIGR00369 family)